jgi:hypothetical protein
MERDKLVRLGAMCEGGYFQENSPPPLHNAPDGDAIIAAICCVPVDLRELNDGKISVCMEEGL